ncbi:MAG: hypothetical protein ACC657_06165 [Thiohalomonadales bacterium]
MRYKNIIYIFSLLLLLVGCATTTTSNKKTEEKNIATEVSLKDGIFYYTGLIDKVANEKLIAMYNELDIKPLWINVKSKGGEINTGMDLGEWIYKVNLNIRVLDYCLSSCANYIFTAAHKKIVSNNAMIGFHGGASSVEFDSSENDAMIAALPTEQQKSEREKFDKMLKQYLDKTNKREKGFFDMIGVSQSITTLGQSPVYYELYGLDDAYQGWYYSIADFRKLGVNNISVIKPPWQPRQLSKNAKSFKVEVNDL